MHPQTHKLNALSLLDFTGKDNECPLLEVNVMLVVKRMQIQRRHAQKALKKGLTWGLNTTQELVHRKEYSIFMCHVRSIIADNWVHLKVDIRS